MVQFKLLMASDKTARIAIAKALAAHGVRIDAEGIGQCAPGTWSALSDALAQHDCCWSYLGESVASYHQWMRKSA